MSVSRLLFRKGLGLLAAFLWVYGLMAVLAQEPPAGSPPDAPPSAVAPQAPESGALPAPVPAAPAPEPPPAAGAPVEPAVPPVPVQPASPDTPPAAAAPAAPAEPAAAAVTPAAQAEAPVAPVAPAGEPAAPPVAEPTAGAAAPAAAAAAPAAPEWFDKTRAPIALIIAIIGGLVTWFTLSAQRGKEMFIRRISGLSALDDAVGRATEMGRGVLYIPGIWDMDDIQTVAGVTILGHVAKKTAEYDTPLFAPMTRSFVMSVAQEVVKQSYLEKGRADAFRADRINYLTDDQFGYVAGVGGIMMREKPAACFYLGCFFAESLILAETGSSVGAIQIAGTAEPSQIPFFVAACDYTLIGEELFAASAYLSKNPKEVGSLKGSDMSKLIIILAILIGTFLVTVSQSQWGEHSYWLKRATEKYMSFLSIE